MYDRIEIKNKTIKKLRIEIKQLEEELANKRIEIDVLTEKLNKLVTTLFKNQ